MQVFINRKHMPIIRRKSYYPQMQRFIKAANKTFKRRLVAISGKNANKQ
jgi:hypothetical protein